MKKWIALMLLLLLPVTALGEEGYTVTEREKDFSYDSETLKYTMETCKVNGSKCYLTTVWMQDPGRQIRKAISPWHEALAEAEELAAKVPGAALAVNGSGYVSPRYPDIPETYPGESEDYWYEPLGSLTVTDGTVMRCLDGIPYYGLILDGEGLKMIVGEDPRALMESHPEQTWSFYDGCPLIRDGSRILDPEWDFALHRARRTVIAGYGDPGHYLIFMVLDKPGVKLTHLTDCLSGDFGVDWAYDLDGGPSSALVRRKNNGRLYLVGGGDQMVADIMAFTE